jgi:hypothetical protein
VLPWPNAQVTGHSLSGSETTGTSVGMRRSQWHCARDVGSTEYVEWILIATGDVPSQ